MSSSSNKRKRVAHIEISSTPSSQTATARAVTFSRQPTGRLGEQSDTIEMQISPEDLAMLQEDPQYSLPAETFLDFERSVHNALGAEEFTTAPDDTAEEMITVLALVFLLTLSRLINYQVDLNSAWLQIRDSQLDELLRHDGKADLSVTCVCCKKTSASYKCKNCFGPKVFCLPCLLEEHACHPLHRVFVCSLSLSCPHMTSFTI